MAAAQFLLDAVPGAVAAYSLRGLRSAWVTGDGRLIRVRAFDGADSQGEADCLGTGEAHVLSLDSPLVNLDATASGRGLTESHVLGDLVDAGAGDYDGLVPTGYDQSGSAVHATQSVGTRQPYAVEAGILATIGATGLPALSWPTQDRFLTLGTGRVGNMGLFAAASEAWCHLSVARRDDSGSAETFSARATSQGAQRTYQFVAQGSNWIVILRGTTNTNSGADTDPHLHLIDWDGSAARYYLDDGEAVNQNVGSAAEQDEDILIGARTKGAPNVFFRGEQAETVFFDGSVVADVAAIQQDVQAYYGLWP